MIIDFPEFDNETMGGNQSFKFIPVNDCASLPTALACVVDENPTPKYGKALLDGLAIIDTLTFLETLEQSAAGVYYKTTIKGKVPQINSGYLALFAEMCTCRHIIIIKDNNGFERMCGTLANGMKFTFNMEIKETPAGSAAIEFLFSSQSIQPSPFVEIPVVS